jgi:hypothetical protein
VTVELKVRFPVDDIELSALHHRAFSPDQPEPDAAIHPWARRLERHSLTWVGAFSSGRLVGFVHVVWDGGNPRVRVPPDRSGPPLARYLLPRLQRITARSRPGTACSAR